MQMTSAFAQCWMGACRAEACQQQFCLQALGDCVETISTACAPF